MSDHVLWNMDTRLITQWKVGQKLTISYCAEGWLANRGFPTEKTCNTVRELGRVGYLAFHQGMHVTWRVVTKRGRYEYTSHYCDAHLPDEIRAVAQ